MVTLQHLHTHTQTHAHTHTNTYTDKGESRQNGRWQETFPPGNQCRAETFLHAWESNTRNLFIFLSIHPFVYQSILSLYLSINYSF